MKQVSNTIVTLIIATTTIFGQVKSTLPQTYTRDAGPVTRQHGASPATNLPETPIWSQDFANGIPASWTNVGRNGFGQPLANALWEYRGPNTTPSDTVGSRGAYANSATIIVSPTNTNGFVIFDSDWRDNNGIAGNFGNGTAPAPHTAALTTGIIDLSQNPSVQLSFNSYHRYFEGRALLVFSTDSGTTWPDTLAVHPNVSVNSSTPTDAVVSVNVSQFIGGQAGVKIQFLFDGTYDDPGAIGSGMGYYFWMIDDIEINAVPSYEMRFVSYADAPPADIIYGPVAGSTKMGQMPKNALSDQTRNITFDANCYNFGTDTLHNIYLKVDIITATNVVQASYTSGTTAVLFPGDTLSYDSLNTYNTPWNPNAMGNYYMVYQLFSDSTSTTFADTLKVSVTNDLMSADFGTFSNNIGTQNIGDDASALAARIDFTQAASVESIWIGLSSNTVAGGSIEVEVFDSTGFDLLTGYPSSSLVWFTPTALTITQAHVNAGYIEIPINPVLQVPANAAYFFSVRMYSNGGANHIGLLNDQSIDQPEFSTIMYWPDDTRWYTGYNNSKTLNALWIRPRIAGGLAISASGPLTFCQGQSVQLSAPPNFDSYLWNTGDTTSTITADTSGVYTVVVSDSLFSDTLQGVVVTVISNPISAISIQQGSNVFCQGSSLTLLADTGALYSYQWFYNGSAIPNSNSSTYNAFAGGTYAVSVTNAGICTALSDDTTITMLPQPMDSIYASGSSTTFCQGDSVLLSAVAGNAGSYQWLINGMPIQGATQPQHYAKSTGLYAVEITGSNSCVGITNNINVSVLPTVITGNISGQVNAITGQNYTYSVAANAAHTYSWAIANGSITSGQGTASIDVTWNQAGQGSLHVEESNGYCSDSASLQVAVVLSIEENNLQGIKVYPNPAGDQITISLDDMHNECRVSLLSITGQLVQKFTLTEQETLVNIQDLSPGVYFFKIEGDNTHVVRFIKK
jgi:hypothetical protein